LRRFAGRAYRLPTSRAAASPDTEDPMPEPVRRSLVFTRAVQFAIASAVLTCGPAAAQTTAPPSAAKANPARASGGHPDLQGVWGFATVTPLQRPKEFGDRTDLTAEERTQQEEQAVRNQFVDQAPRAGDVGAYNRFWIDAGTKAVKTGHNSL